MVIVNKIHKALYTNTQHAVVTSPAEGKSRSKRDMYDGTTRSWKDQWSPGDLIELSHAEFYDIPCTPVTLQFRTPSVEEVAKSGKGIACKMYREGHEWFTEKDAIRETEEFVAIEW